ncbi:hypothetical protein [Azospirillum sp. TSH7]|nr:hypothetical protein [Azospirillum sp. TSH7]
MAHAIVASWGGHIFAESCVGQGTTMRIVMPIISTEPADAWC